MAGLLPYGIDTPRESALREGQEVADAAREIKAWLAAGDTSRASMMCDRMLSSLPNNKLFEGLKLEIENREREVCLEFIRKLTSDLESLDFDARVSAIQQAVNRYPSESQLAQLLKNAIARRDLINGVIAEARNEESSGRYDDSLRRWYTVRELCPAAPLLEKEVHRVEALANCQRRLKHRAAFVDAIFHLSSTGDYAGAVSQCVNALAEYPNDGGFLSLQKTLEEKAQHATKIQAFVAEGLTFLKSQEIDASLESFSKAKAFDEGNLQVRYLIGIALLEKARVVMANDRRKLTVMLDEARNLIPQDAGLQAVSFDSGGKSDEEFEESLVRIEIPGASAPQDTRQPLATPPDEVPVLRPRSAEPVRSLPTPPPAPKHTPAPTLGLTPPRQARSLRKVALVAGLLVGVLVLAWFIFADRSASAGTSVVSPASVEINAAPQGVTILIDGESVGESPVQTKLAPGTHTVLASLAGYESQTMALEFGSGSRTLQIELQPTPLDLHILSDQPGTSVWMDDQGQGEIGVDGLTISGVQPGVRLLKLIAPDAETEISFEFRPGEIPTLKSSPSPQLTKVLFVGSASGESRVECNCAPAGLRVGELAELIQVGGLKVPLAEGQNPAELWLGKNKRKLTIHGSSRSPVATIAMFASGMVRVKEARIDRAAIVHGGREP